jgi:hypothetical protein
MGYLKSLSACPIVLLLAACSSLRNLRVGIAFVPGQGVAAPSYRFLSR